MNYILGLSIITYNSRCTAGIQKHNNRDFYKLRKKALKILFLKSKSLIGRFTFSYKLKNYLKSSEIRRLQLGSGDNNMEGWFNTDLFPKKGFAFLDASKPFNIPDSTFDRIFSEHMIEHISFQEAELQLKECYRILRSGSKIRIATPNLMHFLNLFNDSQGNQEYKKWISLEEHHKSGGLGTALIEWLSDHNQKRIELHRIGIEDHFVHELG